ncbi:hypothetical protein [Citrobacter sp. R-1.5.2]|uniref:hypothetical protein n=1 Tax=Citrobacter sp. R-1.5.2 TaxID=3046183 RepID=UPI002B247159|nr:MULTISPECIES: hypothetical protein [Citrobacter]MEB1083173.1 hypothetical protein [Citrobacter portucalensis]MEB2421246.1 hypothetical protein [Citrobacter sp. R-1.5.2]
MNTVVKLHDKINKSLNNWKFKDACSYHEEMLQYSFEYISEYIKLLTEFGKLDAIHRLLDRHGFLSINENSQFSQQAQHNDIFFCIKFIKELYIPSKHLVTNDKNIILLHLSQQKDKYELLKYLDENINQILNTSLSEQDELIFNFALNSLISAKLISCDLGIKIASILIEMPNVSTLRKKYILSSMIDYFSSREENIFFKLKERQYNHLQKIAFQLNKFFDDNGAKKYYLKFNNAIINTNDVRLRNKSKPRPKIAVCISGLFRGDALAIQSLQENIISPLNADVFIHTWDTWHPWAGLCGGSSSFWAWRLFGSNAQKHCPNYLKDFNNFKKYFPKSAQIIDTPVTAPLTADFLNSIISSTTFKIDNESDFMKSLGSNIDAFTLRNNHNQAKMFYGIYASTQLMIAHEKENDFQYDYVIRARADSAMVNKLSYEFLMKLNDNELAVEMHPEIGPTDHYYVSKRNVHVKISELWKASMASEQLSPFEFFPRYDSHSLMYLWMIINCIIPVTPPVKMGIGTASSNAQPPKNLYDALAYDLQHTAKHLENDEEVIAFLQYLYGFTK